ncbi:NfeD family protein [Nodosilinea sp. LEGE 06152]|uniref:OB-fold-containig protein n=1 Tax=Nodosilinea sp. LEGE 06152 TaxID=2777966 RepID=UPI0018815039|nr:OB-fold-containig protein [Nodosilinea sp. LEGE 06152]MBE9157997.1 NfeD family protein [Nodosilinea sp. LEGE 06152]
MLVYGICFIVGGIFVFLAALGGLDGVDLAGDFDGDFDVAIDSDGDGSLNDIDFGTHLGETFAALRNRWWLPFLSLRFWTFALCFFGLTGLLLTWAQPNLAGWLTTLLALLMGLFCGLVAALVLRSLARQPVSSLIRPEELTGQIATVEIPFDAHSRGKVYLRLRDSTISFFAMTQEEREFQKGDAVLVVGLEHNKLWVASTEGLQT